MTGQHEPNRFDRRQLLKFGGGAAAAAAGAGLLARWKGGVLNPLRAEKADANVIPVPPANTDLFIGGTDGWISLPASPTITTAEGVLVHPDAYAPSLADSGVPGLTTYIFGFRNITDLTNAQQAAQKNHAQYMAPLFFLPEYDPAAPWDFRLSITNLGLAQRPDLFDAHTLHWHGFRNVIPFFDGEPTGSVAVPAGNLFTYVYRPRDPGTYMYHCHVEDVEHVHMGMTGLVWVHALQDKYGVGDQSVALPATPIARNAGGTKANAPKGYAYNDGVAMSDPRSTAYDREYSMLLTEVWAEAHWDDAHIQLPEWSDYRPDFALLNGRIYPETLAPNAPLAAKNWGSRKPYYIPTATDASGDLVPPPGHDNLRRQPMTSLVQCNAGERILLRFANLGFKEAAMTLAGIKMRVVGRDATPMRGVSAPGLVDDRHGADIGFLTNTLNMGAGESFDAIVVAPPHSTGVATDPPDKYVLFNRNFQRSDNLAGNDLGGQATEIWVYPAGKVKPQVLPNHDELV